MKYIKNFLNNKLFKDSFVYVLADVINKAIPFALLPILTHYLTPEDYGVLANYNSYIGFIGIFIGLSTQGVISVNYYKLKKEDLAEFIGNVTYILLTTFVLVSIIVLVFNSFLSNKLGIPLLWLISGGVISLSSYFVLINLSIWLVEQKPKYYSSFQIFQTIVTLGFSLFFVIILSMSWEGRALGMFIGGIITSIISIYILIKRGYLKFKYKKIHIKDALNFGIPLIPHQLSFWFRSGAIVFILSHLVGVKETGLYNVGAQFVMPISVLVVAFNKAWTPYLYRKLSNSPTLPDKKKIVKFTYLYFVAILLIALILSIVAPFVISFMLDEKFEDADMYTSILAFSAAFQGMYLMVVNYIFYIKKNKFLAYITFSISITNVILAYVFIVEFSAIGAVYAKLATSFLNFIFVWYYSNKLYSMPWFSLKN